MNMSKNPLKYSPNNIETPKQKAPFFERFGKRIRSYVATDFNIASIVKVRDNDGNIMTSKGTNKPINAKDKDGNVLLDVQNPTYALIGKSFLNDDKTINVKKALNPFRAIDVAIKALKYGVARAVDKEVATMKPPPSSIGAMIIKGVVQAIVLPLELPVKALKNMTDVGINSVTNTAKRWQTSREQRNAAKKDDVLRAKTIQAPQQENDKIQSQSVAKQKETGRSEVATIPTSVVELGHSVAVQHIRDKLVHNKLPPPLPKNPPIGIETQPKKPVPLPNKAGHNTGQGR